MKRTTAKHNPVKRKSVNLIESDFDIINAYCQDHNLKMFRWIGSMLVGIIKNSKQTDNKEPYELVNK